MDAERIVVVKCLFVVSLVYRHNHFVLKSVEHTSSGINANVFQSSENEPQGIIKNFQAHRDREKKPFG